MSDTTLVADERTPVGTRPARRVRASGRIPAVVYGDGVGPLSVSVDARDLRHALSTPAGLNAVLSVHVGRQEYMAMAREIQRHPVRGTVTHVDFQVVDPDRPVSADVTVVLTGDPVELHHQDGVLEQQLFSISVRAKPSEIPQHFEVDIDALAVGMAVRVSDLVIPAGVEVDLDPDTVIAAGQAPRLCAPRRRRRPRPPKARRLLPRNRLPAELLRRAPLPRSRRPCPALGGWCCRRGPYVRRGRVRRSTCSSWASGIRERSSSTRDTMSAPTPSCCSPLAVGRGFAP